MEVSKLFDDTLYLEKEEVCLRPMQRGDVPYLVALSSPSIWTFMSHAPECPADWEASFRDTMEDRKKGRGQEFVLILKDTGEIIGATRVVLLSVPDQKVEIGRTWISENWQGQGYNTRAKQALLAFLFENIGVNKVVFRTRLRNIKSRRALEKIGAVQEGILREEILRNGEFIDVVYYAILAREWGLIQNGRANGVRGR